MKSKREEKIRAFFFLPQYSSLFGCNFSLFTSRYRFTKISIDLKQRATLHSLDNSHEPQVAHLLASFRRFRNTAHLGDCSLLLVMVSFFGQMPSHNS